MCAWLASSSSMPKLSSKTTDVLAPNSFFVREEIIARAKRKQQLTMQGERVAYLSINSQDDPTSDFPTHNPADFQIDIPNSDRLTGITDVCYSTISIPRVFP